MNHPSLLQDRRRFIRGLAFGAALSSVPGLFAEELMRTPGQGEGPFYPDHLPLDTDNDLLVVNDAITPAVGEVTHLSGRVLDTRGEPIRNALVEIWQVDHSGIYLHSQSGDQSRRDKNFQGFGRFMTGSTGEYYFRMIKPVAYSARTAHIHFALKSRGRERFTTECYIKGEPKNAQDSVLNSIPDPKKRAALIVNFTPLSASKVGELAAKFDIVLG